MECAQCDSWLLTFVTLQVGLNTELPSGLYKTPTQNGCPGLHLQPSGPGHGKTLSTSVLVLQIVHAEKTVSLINSVYLSSTMPETTMLQAARALHAA